MADDAQDMSDRFSRGMEAKLSESLREGGVDGMVTGFVAIVNYIDAEGNQYWSFIANENQPIVTSLGMLDIADMIARHQAANTYLNPS